MNRQDSDHFYVSKHINPAIFYLQKDVCYMTKVEISGLEPEKNVVVLPGR